MLLGRQAKSAADRATAAVTDNPAKDFANRGKAAVRDALPVDGPAAWDLSSLHVDVSQKLQAQASQTAKKASSKVRGAVLICRTSSEQLKAPTLSHCNCGLRKEVMGVSSLPVLSAAAQFHRQVNTSGSHVTHGASRNLLQVKGAVDGIPDPSQFAAKAQKAVKKVSGSVPSNPAADFAAKAKKTVNKAKGGAIGNPARDFANAVSAPSRHMTICVQSRTLAEQR